MDVSLRCVVCRTDVPPDAAVCPRCSEPRVRLCTCGALVELDRRECPSCSHVLERVLTLEVRARRRWRRRAAVAGGVLVVLAGVAALSWPRITASRRAAELWERGEAAAAAGRPAEAAEALREYLRLRPNDARALHLVALAHFELGEPDPGVQAAERALRLDPASPGTHLALARHHAGREEWLLALAHARDAAEPAARGVAGRALTELGRHVEAAAEFDAALGAAPDDVALLVAAARPHRALGDAAWAHADEHRARGDAIVDRALAAHGGAVTDATPHPLRLAVADRRLRAGDAAGAVAALGRAPARPVAASALTERARLLVAAGADRAARGELQAALASDPGDVPAAVALARMELDAGRPAEALAVVGTVRSTLSAGSAELHEVAGDAAAAAGDATLAERHYGAWSEISPRDPRPVRRTLALRAEELLARRSAGGDGPETGARGAVLALDRLAELDPDDRWLLLWRTRWEDAVGRRADAERHLARLLALHPHDAEARALRIRRTFDEGAGDAADRLAAELIGEARTPAVDAREFVDRAVVHGREHLALDVAAAARERAPGDAGVVEDLARVLVVVGRPAAAAAAVDAAPETARAELAALRAVLAAVAREDLRAAPDALTALRVAALLPGGADPVASFVERARATTRRDDPRALAALAEALEDAGAWHEAAEAWDDVLFAADDVVALARGGVARLAAGDLTPSARAVVAQRVDSLNGRPDGADDALALRALFAASEGEPGAAVEDLRHVLARHPHRADLALATARVELATGDAAGAARHARLALYRRPASVPARAVLAEALDALAASHLTAAHVTDALAALDEAAAVPAGAGDRRRRAPLADVLPPRRDPASGVAPRAPRTVGEHALAALRAAAAGRAGDADALAQVAAELHPDAAIVPLVRALLRAAPAASDAQPRPADDPEGFAAAAAERGAPPAEVAFVRAVAAETARAGAGRDVAAAAPERSPRLRAAAGSPDDLAWLLARAPDELDAVGPHAAAQALAASGDPALARRALLRALAVAPSDPAAAASRAALSGLR